MIAPGITKASSSLWICTITCNGREDLSVYTRHGDQAVNGRTKEPPKQPFNDIHEGSADMQFEGQVNTTHIAATRFCIGLIETHDQFWTFANEIHDL